MALPPKVIYPEGDKEIALTKRHISALVADTFEGKIHIEWDPHAQVTPLGHDTVRLTTFCFPFILLAAKRCALD